MSNPESPSRYFETESRNFLGRGGLYTTLVTLKKMADEYPQLYANFRERIGQNPNHDILAGGAFSFQVANFYPFDSKGFESGLGKFMEGCRNGEYKLYRLERVRRTVLF